VTSPTPQHTAPSPPQDHKLTALRFARVLTWVVYAFVIVAVILLTMAFFLLLFGASTDAEFTQWVYRSAGRVLQPFRGIFPSTSLGENGSVLDFAVLFAIIMYGIFALVVSALVSWLDARIVEHRLAAQRAEYERVAAAQNWPPPAVPPSPPSA
jgi:uncharacterized membrane protein YvlD (DUF360 family)